MIIVRWIMVALVLGTLPAGMIWCWWKLLTVDKQRADDWVNNVHHTDDWAKERNRK